MGFVQCKYNKYEPMYGHGYGGYPAYRSHDYGYDKDKYHGGWEHDYKKSSHHDDDDDDDHSDCNDNYDDDEHDKEYNTKHHSSNNGNGKSKYFSYEASFPVGTIVDEQTHSGGDDKGDDGSIIVQPGKQRGSSGNYLNKSSLQPLVHNILKLFVKELYAYPYMAINQDGRKSSSSSYANEPNYDTGDQYESMGSSDRITSSVMDMTSKMGKMNRYLMTVPSTVSIYNPQNSGTTGDNDVGKSASTSYSTSNKPNHETKSV